MNWKKYLLLTAGAGCIVVSILGFSADFTPLAIGGAVLVMMGVKKSQPARQ